MPDKFVSLQGLLAAETIQVAPRLSDVSPQQHPTSDRIKGLLSKGLMSPEALSLDEIREMSASVVYFLLAIKSTGETDQ